MSGGEGLRQPIRREADMEKITMWKNSKKYGFIITNPPYGERIMDKEELPQLYTTIGNVYKSLQDWSLYVITSYEDACKYIGRKADKNRKIYNGMIKTYYYQFMGAKPPKKKKD